MIIYTIMPTELIFPVETAGETNLINRDGRSILARRDADGWRVERLLSTDPADFLDPRWQPGAVLGTELSD